MFFSWLENPALPDVLRALPTAADLTRVATDAELATLPARLRDTAHALQAAAERGETVVVFPVGLGAAVVEALQGKGYLVQTGRGRHTWTRVSFPPAEAAARE